MTPKLLRVTVAALALAGDGTHLALDLTDEMTILVAAS